MNCRLVFVQLKESFREQLAQFAFDGIWLRIQQSAQVRFVGGFDLIWSWPGTEVQERTVNPCGDDQQHCGEDERAEHQEKKLIHSMMILQRGTDEGGRRIGVNIASPGGGWNTLETGLENEVFEDERANAPQMR